MDNLVDETGSSTWRPNKRPDGSIEICTNVRHPTTRRIGFAGLTVPEYLKAWEEGRLQFQIDDKLRPSNCPTPEEVRSVLSTLAQPKASSAVVRPKEQRKALTEFEKAWLATVDPPPPLKDTVKVEEEIETVPLEEIVEISTLQPVEVEKVEEPVVATPDVVEPSEEDEPEVVFEKRRRKPEVKLAALEEAAAELRKEKFQAQPENAEPKLEEQDFQLEGHELIARAAKKLRMSYTGLSTHFYRSVAQETKARWLYGKLGRKRTRAEIKFGILMQVREQFRKKGGPAPRKKELAEAAAGPLGMKLDSTRTYIYDRLKPEEVKALDLRGQFLSLSEQIEVLKNVRKEMKEKGLPAPRPTDLAKAAAPLLRQEVNSVRTLIGGLSEETKAELEFLGTQSNMLATREPAVIREGFLGAIAVLKFRKLPLTVANIHSVLKFELEAIRSYLRENPDLTALLENEKT